MKQTRNHYSDEFKQQVLDDYFQLKTTQKECAKKWGIKRPTLTSCFPQSGTQIRVFVGK